MKFLKKHIKPISIIILSAGGAISLAGFITFLVTGTYSIVQLNSTKTVDGNTEYITSSHSSGWLNFDSYYWTTKYGEINNHGKKTSLSFHQFMAITNTSAFIESTNSYINTQKSLQAATNNEIAKTQYQYDINYHQGLLNVSNQYASALAGSILFPLGIVIAFLTVWLLVCIQKKITIVI